MIGYNLKEAQNVINKMHDNYVKLDQYIVTNWNELKRYLRQEWIGYDEEDFEKKFAERLIDLSNITSETTNASMQTIYDLALAWHEFQATNTLDRSKLTNVGTFNLEIQTTEPRTGDSISAGGLELNDKVTRGLKNGVESANRLKTQITSFVSEVRSRANALAETISADKAFIGEQSASIKKYISKCGEVVGILATSVDDLNQALDILLGKNYVESVNVVNEVLSSTTSKLDDISRNSGSNRWE